MAAHRMFSLAIVNSSKFLKMPPSSRLLYYDLGMAADDDGVVEAFTVIRMTGAAEDDLRVLHAKGFVIVLNDDLVTYITDWNQNNLIRKDRYHQGLYKNLLVKLTDGNQMTTNGIPSGNQTATEDKLSYSKLSKYNNPLPPKGGKRAFVPPTLEEVEEYVKERNSSVDPQTFYDYYTEGNWADAKGNKVKNWKQKLITWEKGDANGRVQSVPGKNKSDNRTPERDYSYLYDF